MYRPKLILLLTCWTFSISYCVAQKRFPKLIGAVKFDNNTFVKQTETTVQEWMYFIINNNFDSSLFPGETYITNATKLIMEDLKKGDRSECFEVVDQKGNYAFSKEFGSKRLKINQKKLGNLLKIEPSNLSINIPITGVSFEQVIKFCKWKEDLVNSHQEFKIHISLPSIELYTKLITNIDSVCNKKCNSCEEYHLNCISAKCYAIKKNKDVKSQGIAVIRADSYWSTDIGLYCIQGNAAEMTSTKGVAMGGSFRHFARDSYSDRRQEYKKPEDWLGFRYIVTPSMTSTAYNKRIGIRRLTLCGRS